MIFGLCGTDLAQILLPNPVRTIHVLPDSSVSGYFSGKIIDLTFCCPVLVTERKERKKERERERKKERKKERCVIKKINKVYINDQ